MAELGHIKIGKITPKHVQDFYAKIKHCKNMKGGEKFKVTDEYLKIVSSMKQMTSRQRPMLMTIL